MTVLWKTFLGINTLWKNPPLFPQVFPQAAILETISNKGFFGVFHNFHRLYYY